MYHETPWEQGIAQRILRQPQLLIASNARESLAEAYDWLQFTAGDIHKQSQQLSSADVILTQVTHVELTAFVQCMNAAFPA